MAVSGGVKKDRRTSGKSRNTGRWPRPLAPVATEGCDPFPLLKKETQEPHVVNFPYPVWYGPPTERFRMPEGVRYVIGTILFPPSHPVTPNLFISSCWRWIGLTGRAALLCGYLPRYRSSSILCKMPGELSGLTGTFEAQPLSVRVCWIPKVRTGLICI